MSMYEFPRTTPKLHPAFGLLDAAWDAYMACYFAAKGQTEEEADRDEPRQYLAPKVLQNIAWCIRTIDFMANSDNRERYHQVAREGMEACIKRWGGQDKYTIIFRQKIVEEMKDIPDFEELYFG